MTRSYRRLHILVEGQSEEIVVRNVLEPYPRDRGWAVNWSIVVTKRSASGASHRGGVSNWAKIEREVRLLLQDTDLAVLTTLFDFYAFPHDAPGVESMPSGDPYQKVEHLEKAITERIGDRRFVPHLILHELETWVFAAAEQLGSLLPDPGLSERLKTRRAGCGRPGAGQRPSDDSAVKTPDLVLRGLLEGERRSSGDR